MTVQERGGPGSGAVTVGPSERLLSFSGRRPEIGALGTVNLGNEVEYFLSEVHDLLELSGREEFRRLPSFRFHLTLWPRSWNANLEGLIVRATFPAGLSLIICVQG